MKIGYYQFEPEFMNPENNYKKVLEKLKEVQADLIVLPELAFTGYNFDNRKQLLEVAEDPHSSEGVKSLISLCKDKDMAIIAGFAEKEGDNVYNSALYLGPNGIEHIYRKIHLFYREKLLFEPGNIPFTIHEYKNVRFGMMICFDWFFPEVTRYFALRGADLICHPSNLVLNYCQNVMISRSIENIIAIITANRIGTEEGSVKSLTFTGQSQIVFPKGKLSHRSPADQEELFITEFDPALSRDKYITEMNHLMEDRRPEFYQD